MASLPDALVEKLYGAPPGEFIAQRDARAKELRGDGDRASADAVKKLRKPSVSAAAVNRLARESTGDVKKLLAAGEALRKVQLGGGDRDAIRSASADERAAVDRLVESAGKLSGAVEDEVRATLHAAATDDETRDLVRRGVLTEARQATGFGGFGVAVSAAKPAARGAAQRAAEPEPEKAAPARPAKKKDAAAERAAAKKQAAAKRAADAERRKAVKAAKQVLREAEKTSKAADRDRDRAAKALDKADRAAEKAAAAVERARADLDAAESR